MAPALMVCILLVAVGIFFLLPRMSGGYLSAYAAGGELSAGFSDRVQLGRIGEIQQSNSVVMHVQVDGDNDGHHDLLWRGVALTIFDGRNWWSPQKRIILPRWSDGRFVLPPAASPQQVRTHLPQNIHYRVLLEPLGTDVFFVAPRGTSISGNYHMLTMDGEGAVYDLDRGHPPTVYEADSDISRPSAAQLRSAASDFSLADWQEYLKLPPRLDDRIPELARQITGTAATNYDTRATRRTVGWCSTAARPLRHPSTNRPGDCGGHGFRGRNNVRPRPPATEVARAPPSRLWLGRRRGWLAERSHPRPPGQ